MSDESLFDPDVSADEDICKDCGYSLEDCACWDDAEDETFDPYGMHYELDDEFIDLPECKMCGKERNCNAEGYCGQCWVIWNS